jgi:hypothetical protein
MESRSSAIHIDDMDDFTMHHQYSLPSDAQLAIVLAQMGHCDYRLQ